MIHSSAAQVFPHTGKADCYCRECFIQRDISALQKKNALMETQIKEMQDMIELIKQSKEMALH